MIVTRGDVDVSPVINSLPFPDIVVWDNSQRENLSCYGRFAGIEEARNDVIYVQDDDVIVPAETLLGYYSGEGVVANKPVGEEWRFLGVGAFFHRSLADCFQPYLDRYGFTPDFCRVADVVFAYQHLYRTAWVGYEELPWSRADNRMYKQPDHYLVRERARDRVAEMYPSAPSGYTPG